MEKYHIVLVPDAKVAIAAEDFAQTHFAHNHDDYCIGSDGHLPHITIAQTDIPDGFEVDDLYAAIIKLDWDEDEILSFGSYYHNKEKNYCGITVEMTEALKRLHDEVVTVHNHLGLFIKSAHGDDFWPHFTLAKTKTPLPDAVSLPEQLQGKTSGWRLEFGRRGENGVYLGRYEPS